MASTDVSFIGGHAANVIGKLLHEIGIQIVERRFHFKRMFLIHAEDDGLGKAVGFLEEVCQMPRNRQGTRAQGNHALEVFGLVFVVGNLAPIAVNFVFARSPARCVPLGDDTVDAVGRKKTVINALTQTVLVDRIAEIQ